MYYCKKGDLLVVNSLYNKITCYFFQQVNEKPYSEAICVGGKKYKRIPHGSIVMALEASVPPWYESDLIRCLWNEEIVFIKRKALKNR